MIANSIDPHKKELFLYARKEILYNESSKLPTKHTSVLSYDEFDGLYQVDKTKMSDMIPVKQAYIKDVSYIIIKLPYVVVV